jgi:small glutamine-rich tetratricopeptide repeat-containing protein alpha
MSSSSNTKELLILSIIELLQREKKTYLNKSEQLEVAIQCLSEAYGLEDSGARRDTAELPHHKLEDVFQRGLASISTKDTDIEKNTSEDFAPGFDAFLETLKRTNYFQGVTPGTEEYEQRVRKAKEKYLQKFGSKITGTSAKENLPEASKGVENSSTEDKKGQAEKLKLEGNDCMRQGKYREALEKYSAAIELDPSNAVFYSNRAAAKTQLNMLSSAIDDCRQAISLNPTFIRPRERLASAYYEAGMFEEALKTANEVLEMEPQNARMSEIVELVKKRNTSSQASSGASNPNDLFQSLLQNPQLMQAASSLFQSGGMQQMFSQLNPGGNNTSNTNSNSAETTANSGESNGDDQAATRNNDDMTNVFENLRNSPLFEQLNANPQLREAMENIERDPNSIMSLLNNPQVMNAAMQSFQSLFGNTTPSPNR